MDFQSRIYGFDGVFPRTLRDLTIRPGVVAESFIKGNRVKYVGPVGYFFLMIAISILIMELIDLNFYEFTKTVTPMGVGQTARTENIRKLLSGFIYENFRVFKFVLIPINAFWIWLFVRKKGYNFLESSVPSFYAQGQLEIILIINLLVLHYFDFSFYSVVFMVEPFYYGLIMVTWMRERKTFNFFKGVIIWILSFVSYVFVVALGGLIWIMTHPELLNPSVDQ